MKTITTAPKHGFKLTDTTIENVEAVEAYLRSINGKATLHTTNDFLELMEFAKDAEDDLNRVQVSKTAKPGCIAYHCDGGASAKSYRYSRTVTGVTLKRYTEGWRLMEAQRVERRPQEPVIWFVRIPAHYIEEIKRKAAYGLRALPAKAAATAA